MDELQELTRSGMILGNHFLNWIAAFALSVAVYLLAPRLRFIIANLLAREGKQPTNIALRSLHSLASRTRSFFLFAVAVWAGTRLLVLPAQVDGFIAGIVLVATLVQAGLWVGGLVALWIDKYLLGAPQADPARTSAAQIIRVMCLTIVWSAILLLMLSNFGVDITGLIAGLGIGGIAIAFALQSILKDLFASLAIILDKPFVVGDFIIFDEQMGTVEQVGLKTTRVRALSGEQITVSNDALLNTNVRNFKRMTERRVVFDLHAYHGAPMDKLSALPGFIERTIEGLERTRFDRAHLADFDEMGARYEVVYFVLDPDFNLYMDIQQQILLAVAGWYRDNDMRFPYPSSRLILDRDTVDTLLAAGRTEEVPARIN